MCGFDIERDFGTQREEYTEICVYARFSHGFQIPTLVEDYAPDWAITFNEGTVKHAYFTIETKGTMDKLHLDSAEQAKTDCATKLFNETCTEGMTYYYIVMYDDLMDKITSLE